jgi:hypothetical protein
MKPKDLSPFLLHIVKLQTPHLENPRGLENFILKAKASICCQ